MLRTILVAGAAAIAGYVIGVRAGFDTGVRDYVENGSQLLEKVATSKDKFNYPRDAGSDGDEVEEVLRRTGFQ